jgi:hypothetical protein
MSLPFYKGNLCHFRRASTDSRRKLAETILETGGNLSKTAYYLGLSRNQTYYLVDTWKLWPVVNEARRRRISQRRKEIKRGFGKHEAVSGALPEN